MPDISANEVWFVTGSQHLYGPETLATVAEHSAAIAAALDAAPGIPVKVVVKPVLTGADEIRRLCQEANASDACIGLVTWMHTFSPAKMWIAGLGGLQKPFLHLHTQFNDEIPWATIDMDFMNLNQAAHGDREFGFLAARLRLERTVVVGHWADASVQDRIGVWARAASARKDWLGGRIARFGDNMREVAVTEGDKLEAQRRLGFSVNSYGVGDLAARVDATSDADVDRLIEAYCDEYDVAPELVPGGERHGSLRDGARIELGLRSFLGDGAFIAFTDTFEDLHGLRQLPGLAVQRLMADGYGFGAEGDWKTGGDGPRHEGDVRRACPAAPRSWRTTRTTSVRRATGSSAPTCSRCARRSRWRGLASRSTRCRSAARRTRCASCSTPTRGRRSLACVTDMGDRFRMVASVVDVVPPEQPLPRLPVARAMWTPRPDLRTNAAAWILAGGSHHTSLGYAITAEHLRDFAAACGTELLVIDETTELDGFRDQLRWNDLYHHLARGL